LVPADWTQRDSHWCRPLIEGLNAPELPLVAITQQVEPLLVYLGAERLAWLGVDGAEAERAALANLARLPGEWRTVQRAAPRGSWLALELLEGPLAAERVLDRALLQTLGEDRVGSSELAIGLPRPGLLLVSSAAMAMESPMAAVVRGLYDEAREAGAVALSPRVFLAQDGQLVGMLA
jgi:hypothetical protein